MLLLLLVLFSVCPGWSATTLETKCYGDTFRFPLEYHPYTFSGQLFFTPTHGGLKKLTMENDKLMDSRFTVNYRVEMQGLTEQDEGVFSLFIGGSSYDVIKLTVSDCRRADTKDYGSLLSMSVPRRAEVLEFTPHETLSSVIVLWNRTAPDVGRVGAVNGNYFEKYPVTQGDSGYYKFRGKKNGLLSWRNIVVKANVRNINIDEDERLFIKYPSQAKVWDIAFESAETQEQHMLLKGHTDVMSGPFGHRIRFLDNGITIDPVHVEDSGIYNFTDANGHTALMVEVDVITKKAPAWVYVIFLVGIVFFVIVCFCCVKRCCCKKSSSKRNSPASQTVAVPAVHYHDTAQTTPPAPVNPSLLAQYERQPPSGYATVQTYNPVKITVNPLPPQVTAPGQRRDTSLLSNNADFIFSDSEPRFELKGLTFPATLPLSSDSTFSDVYTSEKLNFL